MERKQYERDAWLLMLGGMLASPPMAAEATKHVQPDDAPTTETADLFRAILDEDGGKVAKELKEGFGVPCKGKAAKCVIVACKQHGLRRQMERVKQAIANRATKLERPDEFVEFAERLLTTLKERTQ